MTQLNHKTLPLISVVITCYNYGQYIEDALKSVLNQTYKNIEIIIINDGSTDNTEKVVKPYLKTYKNIKYEYQTNKGVIFTRNKAIELVRGDFFLQLDADDTLENDYIATCYKKAHETNADIIYTDYVTFGDKVTVSNFPEFKLEILKNQNFINISSLVRTSTVNNIRFDENLKGVTHEDWDFFLALCMDGSSAVKNPNTHLNYRFHGASRNNLMSSFLEKRNYVDMYAYVIDKHMKSNSDDFEYLVARTFAHWYSDVDNNRKTLIETNNELKLFVSRLQSSREYKIGLVLLHPKRLFKRILQIIKTNLHDQIIYSRNKISRKKNNYFISKTADFKRTSTNAVVIHLYYTDLWKTIVSKLDNIPNRDFDVFVSLPEKNKNFIDVIKKQFTHSQVFIVPNRGRDVLPFVMIGRQLKSNGYKNILKIHSKKSTHRTDGDDWFNDLLDGLLPSKEIVTNIISTLEGKKASIIGPSSFYYPVEVNLAANVTNMKRIIKMFHGPFSQKRINLWDHQQDFGFFGGTMFWARLESIHSIFNFSESFFEKENAQIDGTFAHAVERMLTVEAELNNLDIFEITNTGVFKRTYESHNIPEWFEKH